MRCTLALYGNVVCTVFPLDASLSHEPHFAIFSLLPARGDRAEVLVFQEALLSSFPFLPALAPRCPSSLPTWPPRHLLPAGDSDLQQEHPGTRGKEGGP
jgi:hypothetical protein